MKSGYDYTVETMKSVDDAVAAVDTASQKAGFRVLYIHNVQETLAAKGFARGPLKIVEICNAKFAHEVLKADVKISLMLPCPISVYEEGGKTYICTLKPTIISEFSSSANIAVIAQEVERVVVQIVDSARQ